MGLALLCVLVDCKARWGCARCINRLLIPRYDKAVEEMRIEMRMALRVLGILMMGMGTVWILQGINILPGSFMTGQIVWAYRGAATAVVGLILFGLSFRR